MTSEPSLQHLIFISLQTEFISKKNISVIQWLFLLKHK